METVLKPPGVPSRQSGVAALLGRTANVAPCFIGLTNADFEPIFLNAAGRRLVGLPEDFDVTTLAVSDFFLDEDRNSVRDIMLPTLARDGVWEGDYPFRHFAGEPGALTRWTAFALHDDGGEVIGFACFSTDLSEHLEAERQLRESQARLNVAVDLVGLSSYRWDPQTGALDWDERLRALWGVPSDAAVDTSIWIKGVHPDDRERVEAAVAAAIDPAGDGVYRLEYRVIDMRSGQERWVFTHGQTLFEHGQAVSFTGAVLDITDQKGIEAQLRRSEASVSAILSALPLGVSVFDTEGRQVLSNPAAHRFHLAHMPSRDLESGGRWRGVRPDGSRLPSLDHPGARALRGETTSPGAEFLYTPDQGDAIWTRVSAAPLRDGDGPILGVVSIIEDVDQQRRSEARLRESDERFRRFAENSSDVIWIFDVVAEKLEYLSAAFERTWGRPRAEALADGALWPSTIHPDDGEARAETLDRVIARGEPITHEYRILRDDGSVRWIRDTTFPIRDTDGRVTQIGGIAHDMSSREPLTVYVVDADEQTCASKVELLRRAGHRVATFTDEAGFLEVAPSLASGCVLVRIDDRSAAPFGVARALRARRIDLPVIFEARLEGQLELAIAAMKAGAADILKAPADAPCILDAVALALAEIREASRQEGAAELARSQISLMTSREREVLEGLLNGGTNKTIARTLGISPRTVEIHRARVMERLGAHTLPGAVLAAASAGLKPLRQRGEAK